MIIKNLARLADWAQQQAAECGALDGLPPAVADHCVCSIASVIWRHGFGQQLKPGDDWSIVLEMYTPEKIAEIVREAVATARPRR